MVWAHARKPRQAEQELLLLQRRRHMFRRLLVPWLTVRNLGNKGVIQSSRVKRSFYSFSPLFLEQGKDFARTSRMEMPSSFFPCWYLSLVEILNCEGEWESRNNRVIVGCCTTTTTTFKISMQFPLEWAVVIKETAATNLKIRKRAEKVARPRKWTDRLCLPNSWRKGKTLETIFFLSDSN